MPSPSTDRLAQERQELRALLAIPRPRRRGECLEEARPCPWSACRHHLLLEVGQGERRQGLSLNAPRTGGGRRRYLVSSSDDGSLRLWIDDALSTLVASPYSCVLDLAEREHTVAEVAERLNISSEQVGTESNSALRKLYVGAHRAVGEHVDEQRLPSIKHLARWVRAIFGA